MLYNLWIDKHEYNSSNLEPLIALVNYLVSKILGNIQGTEMLVDLENLGTR